MSQRGGRPIDFQAWAQNQIVKRAVAALEARDEALDQLLLFCAYTVFIRL